MNNKIIMKAIIFLIDVFLYLKIDGKYKVTNKINSKLNINKEWKSCMLAIIVFISGLVILTTVRLLGYTTNTLTNLVTQDRKSVV